MGAGSGGARKEAERSSEEQMSTEALSKLALWRERRERERVTERQGRESAAATSEQVEMRQQLTDFGADGNEKRGRWADNGGEVGDVGGWAVDSSSNCSFVENLEGRACGGLTAFASTDSKHCKSLCCEFVPCHLWQWVVASKTGQEMHGGRTGDEGLAQEGTEGTCLLGLGSLEFPCLSVPEQGNRGEQSLQLVYSGGLRKMRTSGG
jgi:hypothetical protein